MTELAGKAASPMDAASADAPQEARLLTGLREPTWFEVVAADAVARYDALPHHFKPIVVVSRAR